MAYNSLGIYQLYGRFCATDYSRGVKEEIRSLQSKINSLATCIENLGSLHRDVDKRLKAISEKLPAAGLSGGLTEQISQVYIGKKDVSIYDSDQYVADFALESAGGAVISTPNTENFGVAPKSLFGWPICYPTNSPNLMIQPGNLPGECWAFKGSSGTAIIRLLGQVDITSVTLEHISPRHAPSGETSTAPREFSIWGITCESDTTGHFFGQFAYDNKGSPSQTFDVQTQSQEPYHLIRVDIHSNHGNPHYTCVYRLKIHGTLVNAPQYGLQ